jgi:hypothetical protein
MATSTHGSAGWRRSPSSLTSVGSHLIPGLMELNSGATALEAGLVTRHNIAGAGLELPVKDPWEGLAWGCTTQTRENLVLELKLAESQYYQVCSDFLKLFLKILFNLKESE